MATILTHPVIPFSLFLIFGKKRIPILLAVLGIFFSILPDFDVIAFKFGIPYESDWGHRGFTHSILFGVIAAALAVFAKKVLKASPYSIFLFLFVSILSHGILDAMTTGGLGVGFFIPWHGERFFFEFRPIRVSPIGVKNFLTERGWVVLRSELFYVWLPAIILCGIGFVIRKIIDRKRK